MGAVFAIGWFLLLLLSIFAIYRSVGVHFMVNFFPEGRRWYWLPLQLLSLASFAALVHFHPF